LASMAATLVLASGAALVVPNEHARAAFPGINGKIVFSSDRDRDADGSNAQQLSNNPDEDTFPDWQPVP
jgi:hypothetical protein